MCGWRGFAVVVVGVAFAGMACAAEVPSGVGAAAFARWGMDARPSAMGGAFVAIAEGSPTTYYNPAGLGMNVLRQVGGMYTAPYGADFGVSLQYANIVGSLALQSPSRTALRGSVGLGFTWVGQTIDGITLYDDEGMPSVVSAYSSLFLGSVGIALPGAEGIWIGASV
ncbi:MAG: hypothetical protein PHU43_07915, partial [Candidatus Bipolaricaulis sp.]|nr:hypothetical protein [Candidatus Bipolaricaulis sp.]